MNRGTKLNAFGSRVTGKHGMKKSLLKTSSKLRKWHYHAHRNALYQQCSPRLIFSSPNKTGKKPKAKKSRTWSGTGGATSSPTIWIINIFQTWAGNKIAWKEISQWIDTCKAPSMDMIAAIITQSCKTMKKKKNWFVKNGCIFDFLHFIFSFDHTLKGESRNQRWFPSKSLMKETGNLNTICRKKERRCLIYNKPNTSLKMAPIVSKGPSWKIDWFRRIKKGNIMHHGRSQFFSINNIDEKLLVKTPVITPTLKKD